MNNPSGDKQQMLGVGGGDEGEEFIVERIVSHRFRNGRKEYLLAWKGYPEEENTWEPHQNLDCPDLIEEYENRLLQKTRYMNNESSTLKRKPSLDQAPVHNKRGRPPLDRSNYSKQQTSSTTRIEEASAFDRGYEAEKILGATDATGELMLLVQWKGTSEADLVPSRICNVKCPQVVIKFYEERLTWITTQQQTTNDTNNTADNNNMMSSQQTIIDNKNNQATL
ncbi:unnamed protein product [Rotaria magnacalcarata]|uniref:Chromo domain-containing protein n=1 Tax=Rotaria magnacalcarata TaxID=392030 RepID=A0A816RG62_9BILA|nr:unnamed protein product [Rotaria magnacalcarata]CAF1625540.1 unnamed protein product [Rotaria magnacalcarata]CAF2049721.1 unnamed protein product [Rotaria magnacalcarata]CAF2073181.1 unnamed protein product [Rotaria magnacalcarata]CAF2260604.1 unnamed protein product [Rotaria magnacalcarata]